MRYDNFNPRSPCGERPDGCFHTGSDVVISIHAPRAGSDGAMPRLFQMKMISIHAPRAGSDIGYNPLDFDAINFNPRSPCGERRHDRREVRPAARISIHAPRAGSDFVVDQPDIAAPAFQSTLPVRGATIYNYQGQSERWISIHAPRAGSDPQRPPHRRRRTDFNPRSPCGERHAPLPVGLRQLKFQSTLPVRGATCAGHLHRAYQCISIHAPRAGSDYVSIKSFTDFSIFQSTLPVRGATIR